MATPRTSTKSSTKGSTKGSTRSAPAKTPAAASKVKAAAKPAVKPPAAKPAVGKAAPKAAVRAASPGAKKPKGVPPERRRNYVEMAAYYIAERRGFAPGNPLEDWVQAEAEIDRLLAEGRLGG